MIYDCGTMPDGSPWLIMELLEGETLSALLGARAPDGGGADERSAASVRPAAHAAGIIHRDLKPDNLSRARTRLAGGRRVKVLDFGIAKLASLAAAGAHAHADRHADGNGPRTCRRSSAAASRSTGAATLFAGPDPYQMAAASPRSSPTVWASCSTCT